MKRSTLQRLFSLRYPTAAAQNKIQLSTDNCTWEERSDNQAKVTLNWLGADGQTYKLTINGKTYDAGESTSYTLTLPRGIYDYTITATNAAGKSKSVKDKICCNAAPYEAPFCFEVTVNPTTLYTRLKWESRYPDTTNLELEIRKHGDIEYTRLDVDNRFSSTFHLSEHGAYDWRIREVDSTGRSSAWVNGMSFYTSSTVSSELIFKDPLFVKVAEGQTLVSFNWSHTESANSGSMILNGNWECGVGYAQRRYSHILPDGTHTYYFDSTEVNGKVSIASGTVTCDATAPSTPYALKARVIQQDKQIVFTWHSVTDAHAVTYELQWRPNANTAYTTLTSPNPSITLNLPGGGNCEWRLRAVDSFGNATSWVNGASVNIDVTPPSLPKGCKVSLSGNKATLSWTPVSDDSAVLYDISYQLPNESTPRYIYNIKQSSSTLKLSAEGVCSWSVRAKDAAGNATAWVKGASFTYEKPLALELGTPTQKKKSTGQTQITFHWTGSYGASYKLTINGKTYNTGTATSYTLPVSLADGSYEYSVEASRASGGSITSSGSITCDATPPTLSSQTPEVTRQTNKGKLKVALSWSGEAGALYSLYVDNKLVLRNKAVTSWKGSLKDGFHRYELIATDAYGNTTPVIGSINGDATAPKLQLTTPAQSNSGHISWSSNEHATYRVTVDGAEEPCYTGTKASCDLKLSEGKHRYTITATDAAGNYSTLKGNITIDTTAPNITLNPFKIKENKKSQLCEATLSWKGERGCRYTLHIDGKKAVELGTKTSYKLTLGKNEQMRLYLTATDSAGNSNQSETRVLSYDTTAPELSGLTHSMVVNASGKAATTFTWTCQESGGVNFSIKLDGKLISNADALVTKLGNGSYSYTHTGILKGGSHRYSITATDWAGNKASMDGSAFTTPALSLSKPKLSQGSKEGLKNATLTWKAEANTQYTLSLNGQKAQALTLPPGSKQLSYTVADIGNSPCTYRLTATNAQGGLTVAEGSLALNAAGKLQWVNAASPCAIPAGAQALTWSTQGSAGIRNASTQAGLTLGYYFSLEETRQLGVKLASLSKDATLHLQQLGEQSSISLKASAGKGLEHELNLSAGTYYLQVLNANGTAAYGSDCLLDIELATQGNKPRLQAVLASA